jgi:NADH dehydrogenase
MASYVVTGALGFSGRHVTERLLARGDQVRNLTNHPDRANPFGARVVARPLAFDRPDELTAALEGVDTLVNTYWVRFPHSGATHADAVRNSRVLFEAAGRAGVKRIVHVSIANPSPTSRQSYYRGKAQVESALATSGIPHAILRPTVLFGDGPILVNSIAWLLRRFSVFAIPGDGRYGVQPIAVEDLADLIVEAADVDGTFTWDAVGPEVYSFDEFVRAIRAAIGSRTPIVHVPGPIALAAAWVLGRAVDDVLLTGEELESLSSGVLVSHDIPRGRRSFAGWLDANGPRLGRHYLPEVARHFAPNPAQR